MVSLSPARMEGFPFSCFGETRLAEGRLLLKGEATLPVEDGRRSAGGRSRSGGRSPGGCRGKAMGKPAMYSTLPTRLATCEKNQGNKPRGQNRGGHGPNCLWKPLFGNPWKPRVCSPKCAAAPRAGLHHPSEKLLFYQTNGASQPPNHTPSSSLTYQSRDGFPLSPLKDSVLALPKLWFTGHCGVCSLLPFCYPRTVQGVPS